MFLVPLFGVFVVFSGIVMFCCKRMLCIDRFVLPYVYRTYYRHVSGVVSSCLCLCSSSRCRMFAFWVCHYCIYCTSASTSSLHCSAPIVPTVLRPTRVHCTTVRLLHLLCFGPHESIAPRCPYCTYCTSSYMSSLYRGAPTVPIVFRPT